MAKKGKKFDVEGAAQEAENAALTNAVANEVKTESEQADESSKIPRASPMFLEDSNTGVQYKFDRRENRMLKKAASGKVKVNGEEVDFQITSNKGWSKDEEHVIEYIWLTPPGECYGFITLDYKQSALEFAQSTSFVVGYGKANRDNPSRVGGEGEDRRKEAFIKKMAEKKAAAPAEENQTAAQDQAAA